MEGWVILAGSVLVLSVLAARALWRANRLVDRCLAELPPPAQTGDEDDAEPAPEGAHVVHRAADRFRGR